MGSAALIHECSNFVAQLDAHRFGAAIVLCIIAVAGVSVAVVAIAATLRAALVSGACRSTGSERSRRVHHGCRIILGNASRTAVD